MTAPTSDVPDNEMIEFVLASGQRAIAQQLHDVEAMDGKVVQVFGVAAVVIGLAGFATLGGGAIVTCLLIGAGVAFFAAAVAAFHSLYPRDFKGGTFMPHLKDVEKLGRQAKDEVARSMAGSYAENKDRISEKSAGLQATIALTAIEVLMVASALVAARFGPDQHSSCVSSPALAATPSASATQAPAGYYLLSLCRPR